MCENRISPVASRLETASFTKPERPWRGPSSWSTTPRNGGRELCTETLTGGRCSSVLSHKYYLLLGLKQMHLSPKVQLPPLEGFSLSCSQPVLTLQLWWCYYFHRLHLSCLFTELRHLQRSDASGFPVINFFIVLTTSWKALINSQYQEAATAIFSKKLI